MDSNANEETSYGRNQTKRHQSAEKKPHGLVGWLVGWSVGGWVVGWLVGWLVLPSDLFVFF